ncbi:MAG: T9SS type A sorting domain-containing protein [Muribaculaceae bacterium]
MKKIIISALALVMAAGSLGAKNLDEARIYLNPGHGSWGPNDRPMATIPYPALESGMPDTCGFYESNTNLWKVLKAGNTLEKMGVKHENIMYSRVKNGPFPYVKGAADASKFNRSLSEICEEVEANNMDYFLSVHSNAASEGTSTNYPLFIYRGKDGKGSEYQAGSYDMAEKAWPYLKSNEIDPMSNYATSTNLRGDVSFYGSEEGRTDPVSGKTYNGYLGVLKHGCPGFLSEGYFHTYQPARHRALNQDYCHQEGVRYARGIASYFGSTGEKVGYVMGTIKDLHEKIVNKLYKYSVGTEDQWLPLNGAKVTLFKGTTKVSEYTVDNNYNGVFVFENLQPGEYSADYSCEGYKPALDEYKTKFTVKANETTYVKGFLESSTYVPPIPPAVIYENYPDPKQDGYLLPASEYVMEKTIDKKAVEVLAGKTIRRSILRNNNLYVLAVDEAKAPFIYVINPETQAVIKTLNTTGTQGAEYAISDIAFTADNVLIGCNMENTQFAPVGTFRTYKWDNLDEAPKEWFTSQKSGNFFDANTGRVLAVTGDTNNCKVITTAVTTGASRQARFIIFNVENGVQTTDVRNQNSAKYLSTQWGEDFNISISPRDKNNIIINGSLTKPIEYTLNPADASAMTELGAWENDDLQIEDVGASFFKYAKHSLMTVPQIDKTNKVVGIKLFDITDGLNKAKTIVLKNATVEAADASYPIAGAIVDNANISLYLTNGNVINKYITSATQPVVKGIYAYDLKVESTTTGHTFKFMSNDNAVDASIIFSEQATGIEVGRKTIPNVVKGQNSLTITKEDIPCGTKLEWSIELIGNSIPTITRLTDLTANNQYVRATGVVVDNSPESDFFGRIYVGSYKEGPTTDRSAKRGLYAYNPDWSPINTTAYGSSYLNTNYRMGISPDGKIFISDWSDPNSGIYIANPAKLDGEYLNLFRNNTRDKDGLFTNKDGVSVGGSTPGVYVQGTGDATTLYCYSEDVKVGGTSNNVVTYNIGTTKYSWDVAPTKTYQIGNLQANTNGNIIADEKGGVWVAQTRSPGNNTPGVPSLIYVNNEGSVVFNSGDALAEELNGSWGSGFAITPDNGTLIINNSSNEFVAFDINWSNGVPKLSHKYTYKHSIGEGAGNIYQMSFDAAGNLVTAGSYMAVFSIPNECNATRIPAKKAFAIPGSEIIIASPTNATAVENQDGTVTLSWTAPKTNSSFEYVLYFDDVQINTAPSTATSYVFSKPVVGEHTFGVSCLYTNSVETKPTTATLKTSGVEDVIDNGNNTSVIVAPNPTTGIINITAPEEIINVSIFSTSGAKVIDSNEATIDLSDIAPGMYFVKVNNLKAVRVIKK